MKRTYSRRYLHKTFALIVGALLALECAFSAVLLSSAEQALLSERRQNDMAVLAQIAHNIKLMHASILDTCNTLYNNPTVISLMTDKNAEADIAAATVKMFAINRSIVRVNPYIYSIYVYNPFSRAYYSSSHRGLLFRDADLEAFAGGREALPKLKPIYRSIAAPNMEVRSDIELLTYFQYDAMTDGQMNGGIVVNVRNDWLLGNLNAVAGPDGEIIGDVFIVTDAGDFISDRPVGEDFLAALKGLQAGRPADAKERFYQAPLLGREYIISEIPVEGAGFGLLRVVERRLVDGYVSSMRATVAIVTLCFAALAIAAALLLSTRLYRPVGNLIGKVAGRESGAIGDEFDFLGEVFERNAAMLQKYEVERRSYRRIMKNAWLLGLLRGPAADGDALPASEDFAGAADDFAGAAAEYGLAIDPGRGFFVAVLAVDEPFPHGGPDRAHLVFAVLNVASEVLAAKFPNEGVELPDGMVALIVSAGGCASAGGYGGAASGGTANSNAKSNDGGPSAAGYGGASIGAAGSNASVAAGPDDGALLKLIAEAQSTIGRVLGLSVSASVSQRADSLRSLPSLYGQARQNMAYRFLYGRKCAIDAARILDIPDAGAMERFHSAEKNLADELRLGRLPKAKDILAQMFGQFRKLSYTDAMAALFHLIGALRRALAEIAKADAGSRADGIAEIGRNLLGFETLDEFRGDLLAKLDAFFAAATARSASRKHEMIAETVREMVLRNYDDVGLCLTGLASAMKMSTKQLSRIFREQAGRPLPDYINAVRMQKAAELLERTDLSIAKIAARTGILNETYFYTMFKKHFGSSPNAYKTAMALGKALPESSEARL
ncbi:MAG: AraC family transcriptional regulator [Clostridiales bacterium]|nr:AraC family transcriptional regulator [Clostridiales bacterium]